MASPTAKRRSDSWPPDHLLLPKRRVTRSYGNGEIDFLPGLPTAKRRVTRSYGAGEIDFLPRLPTELSQLILGQLSVRDLARCMSVSKAWYGLANSDSLWRRLCLKHDLSPQDEENFTVDEDSGLCKWAQIWRWFRCSPSWGWYARRWSTIGLFNIYGINLKQASDGQSAAFISGSVLFVKLSTEIEKIKYQIRLPFSEAATSSTYCCLAVQNEYIVVTKCNIVLIYKMGKYRYRCMTALSLTEDQRFNKTHTAIRRFVKNEMRKTSATISIMAFKETWLWLHDRLSWKDFVFDLLTEEVKRVYVLRYRYLTPTWFISLARRKLKVHDFSGRTIMKLKEDIYKVRGANSRLLLTLGVDKENSVVEPGGRGGHSVRQVVEIWEVSTGRRLSRKPRPPHAFFVLHPTKDILYEVNHETKAITAVDAVTGGPLWEVGLPNGVTTFDEWYLKGVCDRYLMLFQSYLPPRSYRSPVYLFNALTGQYMYSTDRLPGDLVHVSDSLIISRTVSHIYLRTFVC